MYYTLVWASCWLSSEESACRKKKEYACSAGDAGSIPGSGYSLWGYKESDMIEQLSMHAIH